MPNFKVFTKRLVPLAQLPYVTVQRKGILSLNLSAFEELGKPEAVELMYDSDEEIIGIRAVEPTIEHAYPIRKSGETTILVSGIAFARFFNINSDTARRYPAVMDDGILCVDLKGGGTDVTGPRTGPRTIDGPASPEPEE